MELYQLKTFVKVADTGNLTRASEALFTSQPAVSAQIKALEDELGIQLFSRTPKGMQLTPAGKHLYQHANQTLESAEVIRQEAHALRNEILGEVRIGVHTDFAFMLTGKLFQALAVRHPRITLHFLQTASATVVQQIRRDELDAGFMFGPCKASDMATFCLSEVPMCVAGPADWADKVEQAELEDLARLPWVYTTTNCPFYHLSEELFAPSSAKPEKLVLGDTEEAVRELIKAGAGLALLRQDDATRLKNTGLVCCWQGKVPSIALNFITFKRRQHEAAIQAFTDCVSEHWNLSESCQASEVG